MFKNLSIAAKLRIIFIPIVLIPMVIITLISLNIISERIDERAKEQLGGATSFIENIIGERKENILHFAQLFSELQVVKDATLYATLAGDSSQLEEEVSTYRESLRVDLIEILDIEGNLLATDKGAQEIGDLRVRSYDREIVLDKRESQLYSDGFEIIIGGIVPLIGDDEEVMGSGILGYRINDNILIELKALADVELLLAKDGKVAASTFGEELSSSVGPILVEKMSEGLRSGDSFLGSIPIGGNNFFASYLPLRGRDEEVVGLLFVGLDGQDVVAAKVDALKTLAIILAVAIALILVIGYLFARSIVNPIRQVVSVLRDIAEGDLTRRINYESRDEMGRLAYWVNSFINDLESIIKEVVEMAQRVDSSSRSLSEDISETSSYAESTADSIKSIGSGVVENLSSVERIASAMHELSDSIRSISNEAGEAYNRSADAVKIAEDNSLQIQTAASAIGEITEAVQTTSKVIQELSSTSDKIGTFAGTITAIASQTNLLALNASIEAARAGEQGSGFAVVAEEVRKLAEESSEVTKEINLLIEDIQERIKLATETIEIGTTKVVGVNKVSTQVSEALKAIISAVNEVSSMQNSILSSTEGESDNTKKVEETTRGIADVSQNTSSRVKQVSDSTEQQAQIAKEISVKAKELQGLAETLRNLVSRFKTNSQNVVVIDQDLVGT